MKKLTERKQLFRFENYLVHGVFRSSFKLALAKLDVPGKILS